MPLLDVQVILRWVNPKVQDSPQALLGQRVDNQVKLKLLILDIPEAESSLCNAKLAGAVNPDIAAIEIHVTTLAVTRAEVLAAKTLKMEAARAQTAAPPAKH